MGVILKLFQNYSENFEITQDNLKTQRHKDEKSSERKVFPHHYLSKAFKCFGWFWIFLKVFSEIKKKSYWELGNKALDFALKP